MINKFPMMSNKEVEIIDNLLKDLKPKNCLEWGAGGSTLYFPKKYDFIDNWLSIEHDGDWYEKLEKEVSINVDLRLVKLEEYLSTAKDNKYDFILIDGLMRKECLWYAQDLIAKDGIILMHDTGRADYHKAIKEWEGKSEKLTDGEIEIKTFAHRGLHKFWL